MIAWFLCPYKRKLGVPIPTRYCAMNDFTPLIRADAGDWREAEIDGNQAIVRVEASATTLSAIELVHTRLTEAQARAAWTPTRSKPRWNAQTQEIEFTTTQVATRPIDDLATRAR
jgi:hypothetical protein